MKNLRLSILLGILAVTAIVFSRQVFIGNEREFLPSQDQKSGGVNCPSKDELLDEIKKGEFVCPECIDSKNTDNELSHRFFNDFLKDRPGATQVDYFNYRYTALVQNNCQETLSNIKANSKNSEPNDSPLKNNSVGDKITVYGIPSRISTGGGFSFHKIDKNGQVLLGDNDWFWANPRDLTDKEIERVFTLLDNNNDRIFKITGTKDEDDCGYYKGVCLKSVTFDSLTIIK